MTYNRPEDQYRVPKAREMIEQLKREAQIRPPTCKFSKVIPYKQILFNGVEHAGTLVHKCSLSPGHEGLCKCANPCGVEWQGWES